MSNRAQRRAMARSQRERNRDPIGQYSVQERYAMLTKNGITPDDVQKAYEQGLKEGRVQGAAMSLQKCYCAMFLSLKEVLHFGRKRSMRVMEYADEKVRWALDSDELPEEMLARCGVKINFGADFDRIVKL